MSAKRGNGGSVRWGILGAANIARKNWKAIANSGNGTVSAVAARSSKRAEEFVAECQARAPMAKIPRVASDYQDLLNSAEVDAVYIPLPTGLRKEWVIQVAQAGKHVLCEKPCATSVAELHEMVEACARNGVQFMDGVMFMHSGRLPKLRAVLDDGESVGKVRRISSAFSFGATPDFYTSNIRADAKLEPFGCLGDLGWYCIRLALWCMNWEMPVEVRGKVLSKMDGSGQKAVPTEFSGELFFAGGVSSGFYCSFVAENQQWAHISGTKGYARFPDFVLPFDGKKVSFEVCRDEFSKDVCDFRMTPRCRQITSDEESQSRPNSQETNMFRTFAECVLSGKIDSHWPKIALQTQEVMEKLLDGAQSDG